MADDLNFKTEIDDVPNIDIEGDVETLDMPEDIPENIEIPGGEPELLNGGDEEMIDDIPENVETLIEGPELSHNEGEDANESMPEDVRDDPLTSEAQLQDKLEEIVQNENLTVDQKKDLLRDVQARLLDAKTAETDIPDETTESEGPTLTLKRDELSQLKTIYEGVQNALEVKADDYRDKGYSEEEIAQLLARDEQTYLKEELAWAFNDGQDISPDVFHAFRAHSRSAKNSGADIQTVSDIEGWVGDINPNFDAFDTESPYSNNCGSCALAVYNRLNGDAEACATAENIGYNDEMNALTGMEQVPMSPEEIESRLLEEGEGAHAIIGIDRAEGPGHWFNAACVDGKVVAIDGQSGEVMDWPPDYGDVVNWEMSVKKEDR